MIIITKIISYIQRDWQRTKKAISFLRNNSDLFIILLLSGISFAGVLAIGFIDIQHQWENISRIIFTILFCYFTCYFIGTYFSAVFLFCVVNRLQIKDGSIRKGFDAANHILSTIFVWSMISGAIGSIVQVIYSILDSAEDILLNFIGALVQLFADILAIANYFLLITMVTKKMGIRQSIHFVKTNIEQPGSTFVKSFLSGFSLSLLLLLIFIPIIYLTQSILIFVIFISLFITAELFIRNIIKASLYLHYIEHTKSQLICGLSALT